jgi:hypothetical protein
MCLRYVPILIAAAGSLWPQELVVRETQAPGVMERAIVVGRGKLGHSEAVAQGRSFLRLLGGRYKLASLIVGEDEMDVRASLYHQCWPIGGEDGDHSAAISRVLGDISRVGRPRSPVARVLFLSGNAVLSYRSGTGLSEQVLVGRDPARLPAGPISYRLLSFALTEAKASLSPAGRYGIAFFVQSSPRISMESVAALARRLQSLVAIGNVGISVRLDAWFLEHDQYPLLPWWAEGRMVPPSLGEYQLAPSLDCGRTPEHAMQCSGQGIEP